MRLFLTCHKKHKSTVLLAFLIFLLPFNASSQTTQNIPKNNPSDTLKNIHLDQLIKEYRIPEAVDVINKRVTQAKQNNNTEALGDAYRKLASVYSVIGYYDTSEIYYEKALEIYNGLGVLKKIDVTATKLANVYANQNFFAGPNPHDLGRNIRSKFDSLHPVAQKLSRELNSEQLFLGYENKLLNYFYVYNLDSLYTISNKALEEISKISFAKDLNFSGDLDPDTLQSRLILEFKLSKAHTLIRMGKKKEGNELLFKINFDEYAGYIQHDNDYYSKLANFNYYKSIYFKEKGKSDSALHYMSLSDDYKYKSIVNYRKRTATNGKLIHKITAAEENYTHALDMLSKDKKISKMYLFLLAISIILILILIISLVYYSLSRRRIAGYNNRLKQYNLKLKKVDSERIRFFSILSHELRTPVYGISGLTDILLEEKNKKQRKQHLNSLKLSINYISILINNVLQFSKFGGPSKKPELQPTDIRELLYSTMHTVGIFAKNKNLKLLLNADNLPQSPIMTDSVSLKQILINLIYNAIKFTQSGTVQISVSESGRDQAGIRLLFEIIDDGSGIDENRQQQIFEPYNVVGDDLENSGTGLGLHIVRSLLAFHDEEIKIRSKVGAGSNFYFEMNFPFAISINCNSSEELIFGSHPKRVLIVDDNKINLLVSKKNVEKIEHFTAVTAQSGSEGIELAKETNFDLILMDINMPEIDGYMATRTIRNFNKTVPIVALTALNFSEAHKKSINSGMNFVITKPYNFDEFRTLLHHYCRQLPAVS